MKRRSFGALTKFYGMTHGFANYNLLFRLRFTPKILNQTGGRVAPRLKVLHFSLTLFNLINFKILKWCIMYFRKVPFIMQLAET